MFSNNEHLQDLLKLHKAIDEMPHAPACSNDPDLFFLDGARNYLDEQTIRRACQPCPIRQQCLDFAVKHAEMGVWGGVRFTRRPYEVGAA